MNALAALMFLACIKPLPPTLAPGELLTYETADGWVNELRHYPADGPPVLLVHGMGANHYNWDYREEVSLAAHLQARGWDVWIPAMRGDPSTIPPNRRAERSFDFDQFATLDMPAAVDAVLAITERDQLYWVGHSMGGMLLYTALSQYPEKVRAGVAIASPARFDVVPPLHQIARVAGSLSVGNSRPPTAAAAGIAPTRGPFLNTLANGENMDIAVTRGLQKHAIVDGTAALNRQTVGWLKTGELCGADREPLLDGAEGAAEVPLLVMGGRLDKIAPWENVAAACEIFPNCGWLFLDPSEGFSREYGHIDTVLGETAKEEIYPLIAGFLEANR